MRTVNLTKSYESYEVGLRKIKIIKMLDLLKSYFLNPHSCEDCGVSSRHHIQTWLDELFRFLPSLSLPRKLELFFDVLIEKIFIFLRLAVFKDDFNCSDIQLRTACFIEEARKKGIKFRVLHGPFGYTNHFQAEFKGKIFRFESLPIAGFANNSKASMIDDKIKIKLELKKAGFPVVKGKSFWFWQKKQAVKFGINQLGFPLVVKPRAGSVSRHVTTDIQDIDRFKSAIKKAIIYSPVFIIEKFMPNSFVHRATIIDFNFFACVKQLPANVVGDGLSTVRELINKKNNDSRRGKPRQKEFTLYKIVENEALKNLLSEKGYDFSTILQKGEILYLQKDPFLKLGGDLIETTAQTHPDNIQLFRDIAKFFDVRIVGIDFIAEDISVSWKKQLCAVLELNSAPCIEMHHFPFSGSPQNVAKAVCDLFFKYYRPFAK